MDTSRRSPAERAISRARSSSRLRAAAVAHEIGWAWWVSGQLSGAAELERKSGELEAAEGHALRSLELSMSLGDRRRVMHTGAELAVIAAKRGDAERAGRL